MTRNDTVRHNPLLLLLTLLMALVMNGCCSYRLAPKAVPDPLPPFQVPGRLRVALVLGSGGIRGMAHVGVLEELEAAGIPIDIIVGCSAGSIVGALYADSLDTDCVKRAVWEIKEDSVLDIDLLHCRYGLSSGRQLHRVLDRYLQAETFDQLKKPLVIVASDLHSGELVPIGGGDLVKAVRASCSIPFVFVPCVHMGRILVDGGVINPVPVRIAKDLGADVIIAVDLCEMLEQTFPSNLFTVTTRSAEIAFMWQNEVCTRHADVVIRPKTCGVGTFNEAMKWQVYTAGKRAAREQIPLIKKILALFPTDDEQACAPRTVSLRCYAPKITTEE